MIVVEGPDGAGKTTLARRLASEFGFNIYKVEDRDKMDAGQRARHYTTLADAVRGDGPITIHDRHYQSEVVYGPLWRGKCEYNAFELIHFREILRAMRVPVIYCNPPKEIIRQNVIGSPQHNKVWSSLNEVMTMYAMKFFRPVDPFKIMYDYTHVWEEEQYKHIVEAVQQYVDVRKERTWNE